MSTTTSAIDRLIGSHFDGTRIDLGGIYRIVNKYRNEDPFLHKMARLIECSENKQKAVENILTTLVEAHIGYRDNLIKRAMEAPSTPIVLPINECPEWVLEKLK